MQITYHHTWRCVHSSNVLENEKESVFKYKNSVVDVEYDAYEKDIATANFYFESSTVLQYVRKPRLTWIGIVGLIGGLLGICLGFSIISLVELFYWGLYKLMTGLNLTLGISRGHPPQVSGLIFKNDTMRLRFPHQLPILHRQINWDNLFFSTIAFTINLPIVQLPHNCVKL